MAKLIKNKSVSFNVLDPYQKKLFDHCIQYENFSSYIKALIQRDIEGGSNKAPKEIVNIIEETQNEDFMCDLI